MCFTSDNKEWCKDRHSDPCTLFSLRHKGVLLCHKDNYVESLFCNDTEVLVAGDDIVLVKFNLELGIIVPYR